MGGAGGASPPRPPRPAPRPPRPPPAGGARQRALRVAGEAAELDLLDVQVGGAVVRHEHRHLERLAGDDDAIVGQRLDAHAVGEQDRRLEFALFLPQPEVDVVARGVVERHRAELAAQHADRTQARRERRHDRVASLAVESPLRELDRRVDFAQAIDER